MGKFMYDGNAGIMYIAGNPHDAETYAPMDEQVSWDDIEFDIAMEDGVAYIEIEEAA